MIRKWVAFALAVGVTYVLAAMASTQSVLASLKRMGAEVSLGQRFEAIGHDLIGMGTSYLPLVGVALLIAFIITGIIHRRLQKWRIGLYVIAGGTAVVAIHLILNRRVSDHASCCCKNRVRPRRAGCCRNGWWLCIYPLAAIRLLNGRSRAR